MAFSSIPQILGLILVLLIITVLLVTFQSQRVDPYFRDTTIELPYSTNIDEWGQIRLTEHFTPKFISNPVVRTLALLKTGVRIPFYSLIIREQPLGSTEAEIIQRIHELRFNPDRPYVITGSHYSDLYMRNLGIFFNALLDPRIPSTPEDWANRQRLALQTVKYDLAFLEQSGRAVTTIVPLDRQGFTGVNIYTEPSDALHAVLYTLKAMVDEHFIARRFPKNISTQNHRLQTQFQATQLLEQYRPALTTAINQYLEYAQDPQTGLVRRDIHLSSARDGVKRQSSFFDNVILWATVQLADELGVPHQATLHSETWKQRIIAQYWDEEQGIFRDDLSDCDASGQNCPPAEFSADSLIVTSTGFLDLSVESDKTTLVRMLQYIENNRLDEPFPLRYSSTNRVTPKHLTVKIFAPSYMGDGIWSHWGMEYIKALDFVGDALPGSTERARRHLDSYRQNIEKYGGYPELYNADGTFFHSTLLRSVLHTGWVINYEQARMLVK